MTGIPGRPLLSVIVPAYQGMRVLPRTLAALEASDLPRAAWEMIVVDDASTDGTQEVAATFADVVVRLPGRPLGPGYARNRGSEVARGEILVFIDADVCVHVDTLRRFAWVFLEQPDVSAVFGAYDTAPDAPGIASQYRNLLHHYVHRRSAGEAATFWAGCGAIRASAFRQVGQYDEWHYSRPQIEDIELGGRLRDHGHRILLCPEIQAQHLKRWRLRDIISTDFADRGVPWTRLLMRRGEISGAQDLNLRPAERLSTGLVGIAILLGIGAVVTGRWGYVGVAILWVIPVFLLNWDLYRFFRRERGFWFMVCVLPLHFAYYALNLVSVVSGWLLHHALGEPQAPAHTQALSEVGHQRWPPVPRRAAPVRAEYGVAASGPQPQIDETVPPPPPREA